MKKPLFNYVHDVLSKNELIIVPNFGAFVLQKTTTFLNDGDYISIIFSAQQQNDDGILSSYIASQNNCTEADAEEFIESSLEEIYNTINSTGIYNVNGIGEFRAINDRIVFKPYDDQFLLITTEESTDVKVETKILDEEIKPVITEPEKKVEPITSIHIEKQTEKVDIEAIRKTYAERNVTNTTNVEKNNTSEHADPMIPKPAKTEVPKNKEERKPIDYSKVKAPLLIIIILAFLGIAGYFFRNELASLNKPTVTNDTSQVVTTQGMEQLADTLNEIQNLQETQITNEPEQEVIAITEPVENPSPSNASPSNVNYGNNTITMYYVTKASFKNKEDANTEEKNLDYTGFEASVVETDGIKKYHVVIAEFSDVQLAKQELAFAKEIDNSFYLMTVKPRNK
jgi:nucleoid DNA-binding protein